MLSHPQALRDMDNLNTPLMTCSHVQEQCSARILSFHTSASVTLLELHLAQKQECVSLLVLRVVV